MGRACVWSNTLNRVLQVDLTARGVSLITFSSTTPPNTHVNRDEEAYVVALAIEAWLINPADNPLPKLPLDLSAGTSFQQKVWKELQGIPMGQTRTYKDIASALGMPLGARAVGNACGSNPVPILVPCHRVVRSDGACGGFTGGASIKLLLLGLEGVQEYQTKSIQEGRGG